MATASELLVSEVAEFIRAATNGRGVAPGMEAALVRQLFASGLVLWPTELHDYETNNFDTSEQFTRSVDFSYLKKGDSFLFSPLSEYGVRLGIADMDGHAVSDTYGEGTGNVYYTRSYPEKNYINVRWEDQFYTKSNPNDSLIAKSPGLVFVSQSTYNRIESFKTNRLNAEREAKIAKVRAQIKDTESLLVDLRNQLQTVSCPPSK